jgi:hypothetical protein
MIDLATTEETDTPTHCGENNSCGGDFSPPAPRPRTGLLFAVPPRSEDLQKLAELPDAVASNLRRTLKALEKIHQAPDRKKKLECRLQALQFNNERGFSAVSLHRKYYKFLETRDWKCLVDRAMAGPDWWNLDGTSRSLPEEFVEFWKRLCEENQRKCTPAHRELLKIWRTRRDSLGRTYTAIPGYSDWPEIGPCGTHPRGWSLENLMRRAPGDVERAAARIGKFEASRHSRQVLKTRVGLSVGQFILFDDKEYDVKVNFPGSPRAMRPLGLTALDLFSACAFSYGFKPTLIGEDGAKKKLKEVDMLWFVTNVLLESGYNPEVGTQFVVEHGTAAIREDFAERIAACTENKVGVQRSGITGDPAFAALYEGAAKGNPRFKAPLESFFNLATNEMAMLPGQVGKDRDHSPVELYGRDLENTRLIKAAQVLGPERAALLRMPFWNWQEFQLFAMDVYRSINSRTDHALEGWVKAGLVRKEWRLGCNVTLLPAAQANWLPIETFTELPCEQRHALAKIIESRTRLLSPWEVWTAGCQKLKKLPRALLPKLLGPEFSVIRTIRGGYIEIQDQEVDSEPMHFNAFGGQCGSHPGARLNNGDQYRAYLNPFNPTYLILTNIKDNSFVAELPRQERSSWSDIKGIQRQIGAAQTEMNERLAALGLRHIERARKRAADARHNAEILASGDQLARIKPKTDEDRDLDKLFKAAMAENLPKGPCGSHQENTSTEEEL